MRMNHESSLTPRWIVFGTALVYFALGSVLTAHFMHLKEEWADSRRVFQLEIHHAVPGKVPALERRFRSASRLQGGHGLDVAGYGLPEDGKFAQTDPAFANNVLPCASNRNQIFPATFQNLGASWRLQPGSWANRTDTPR